MADSFATRFAAVRSRFGPLAWGLDPSGSILEAWGVGDTPSGLDRFADIAVGSGQWDRGVGQAPVSLLRAARLAGNPNPPAPHHRGRNAGLLVIVDAKRGDVGTTNDAYAEAYLGPDAPLSADALTVHPYLGLAAMSGFVDRAHESGSCLLVVIRSSNPEGRSIQSAKADAGRTVEEDLLLGIGELNARFAPGGIGPIGAVVGPVQFEPSLDLTAAHAIFLAPGVGAQGATASDVADIFSACPDRVIPSASRSLLAGGPHVARLRETTGTLAEEFRSLLSACR